MVLSRDRLANCALTLRAATVEDIPQLYTWRTDPETRRQSFFQGVTSSGFRAHCSALLRDVNTRVYVAEAAGIAAGTGHIAWQADGSGAYAEISYTLAPECRGVGLAPPLVDLLTREAQRLGHTRIVARVKAGNIASLRALERSGYRIVETIIELAYADR